MFNFSYQGFWKIYFLSFQEFFNKIMLVFSKKVILYSKAFKYPRYKKVFNDENLKARFSDMKKLQKASKIKINHKFFFEWFIKKKTIDPMRFMKMFWLISANWCLKQNIVSGMAFRWSDTPQYMELCMTVISHVSAR